VKVGDLVCLVIHKEAHGRRHTGSKVGLVLEMIQKKCWRTDKLGSQVDWAKVDPEPHAVILFRGNKLSIPLVDLEVISESR